MRYISTRGTAPTLGFEDVVLTGLARDGGLYIPEAWPPVAPDAIRAFAGAGYADSAYRIMRPFIDAECIDDAALRALIGETYAVFDDPAIAPLRQLDDETWLLELFHGPTLAFKDFALQFLGRMFERILAKRAQRITIVGATSGDTGSAAIEACRGRDNLDIFMLHPAGRVSDVQRRQMTTVLAPNVHNIAIEGTFDDCQDLVKGMFNDEGFRDALKLSAVNSINWARVMAQIVYYFTAAAKLGAPDQPVSFVVPTGNFGNVYAGYAAHQMGLGDAQLIVASNQNDILTRFFEAGDMSIAPVRPSYSPSMDIQISSNFERLLFDLLDRDGAAVATAVKTFRESGSLPDGKRLRAAAGSVFTGFRTVDADTLATIRSTYEANGILVDPHTAVGLGAARQLDADGTPRVVLATAHPAKFPDAVEKATGVRPELPAPLADLFAREERCETLANDLATVQAYVRDKAPIAA
ncbi:MAG: threonine synthase [Alphaproteobacteria bacterium]|nr:threonine synthase [Alphaproteobacteria bacterium]